TLDIARPALAADHKLLPQLLPQLLPCLSNLSCLLTITVKIDTELLHALQRHPSATMVITSFSRLPGEMVHSDLGKVILKTLRISGGDESKYQPRIARLRESSIRLEQLVVHRAGFLKEPFGNNRFHGLVELELKMVVDSTDLAWLSTFIFAHPYLRKISFTDFHYTYFENNTAFMFIDPFIKGIAQEGLTSASYVKGFAITRDISKLSTEALHHWCVTGLFLHILGSLVQVLRLASSMFPKISVLTIDNAPCTVDELTTSLRRFSSLSIVSLLYTFQRMDFGSDEPWRDPSIVEVYEGSLLGPVATEFAMVWCTSRIAKLIPSIQAFYIEEKCHNRVGETGGDWGIQGWILVHDLQLNHPIQLHCSPPTRRPGWYPGWRSNSTPLSASTSSSTSSFTTVTADMSMSAAEIHPNDSSNTIHFSQCDRSLGLSTSNGKPSPAPPPKTLKRISKVSVSSTSFPERGWDDDTPTNGNVLDFRTELPVSR
ncbi:hypothetical protein FB446DRAFT_710138, partial [Lentinula raphanica]